MLVVKTIEHITFTLLVMATIGLWRNRTRINEKLFETN